MNGNRIHLSGRDGATGRPLSPPLDVATVLARIVRADRDEPAAEKASLATASAARKLADNAYGVIGDVDPFDLAEAGWAVVYHPDTPAAVRAALAPLVLARGGEPGGIEYVPGESWVEFRARHDQGPGPVDPEKLPYYLLLAASPEQIPFRFQYGLDADHAVGRLHFDDPAGYAAYVKRLLDYENGQGRVARERRAAVFAPQHEGDESSMRTRCWLAEPLEGKIAGRGVKVAGARVPFAVEHSFGEAAVRTALADLVTREDRAPALVFTAGHGAAYRRGHVNQLARQGALVCQEPGPPGWALDQELPANMRFAAEDVPAGAALDGLVVFCFGCYTAGTPRKDDFAHLLGEPPAQLAAEPFLAALPQALLSRGALAVVGHVERAWSCSFLSAGVGSDVTSLSSTVRSFLAGWPAGLAFEALNQRYLSLSAEVAELVGAHRQGDAIDEDSLVNKWMALNDARGFLLLGDPGARIAAEHLSEVADD